MSSETVAPLDPVPPVPPRRTQLLDLPEELVLRIFETVFDELLAERIRGQYENNPFPSHLRFEKQRPHPRQLSLQQLPINSGLYNLVRPVWDGYLALQASEGRAFVEPLPTLSKRIRFLDLVEDKWFDTIRVYGEIPHGLTASERVRPSFDFLTTFSRITTLRATFTRGIPRTFTDALSHLPCLSDLTLQFPGGMDDVFFTLGEKTPVLRRLTLAAEVAGDEDLHALLTNLPSTLEEVHIYYTYPAGLPIPWYTVPRLHLNLPKGYFRNPACVIEAFEKVFAPEVRQDRFLAVRSASNQTYGATEPARGRRRGTYDPGHDAQPGEVRGTRHGLLRGGHPDAARVYAADDFNQAPALLWLWRPPVVEEQHPHRLDRVRHAARASVRYRLLPGTFEKELCASSGSSRVRLPLCRLPSATISPLSRTFSPCFPHSASSSSQALGSSRTNPSLRRLCRPARSPLPPATTPPLRCLH